MGEEKKERKEDEEEQLGVGRGKKGSRKGVDGGGTGGEGGGGWRVEKDEERKISKKSNICLLP